MSEFDEEKKNEQQNEQQSEYYNPQTANPQPEQPQQTPPQQPYTEQAQPTEQPQEDNTTYHYSYVNHNQSAAQNAGASEQSGSNYYQQPSQQPSQQSYYQPPQSEQRSYYTPPVHEQEQSNTAQPDDKNAKPKKKKNKAGIIVAVVLIVCVIVAVAGIVISSSSASSGSSESGTSQSQSSESDIKTKDSSSSSTQDADGNLTVKGVVDKVVDSCVGITVYSQQQSAYNYFNGYGNNSDSSDSSNQTESGEGSGIIMSESNGKTYILTCAHVISEGDSFKVTLNNKKEYDAKMVAYDSQTDIGVLSIEATGLQTAEFANSKNIAVGDQVVAIGCPGGLEFMNSTTVGYVSALDRPISSSIGYDNNCIQVDAAINPGNSGGALFNMQGQVIGVNSSKIAATEYEGMGFAIPADTAIDVANSLIKAGYVEGRAKIGITYTPLSSYNNASSIESALEEKGYKNAAGTMVISSVDGSSDLASKDVKQYDMIVAINGKTLTSTDVVTSVLSESKPGDTVKLTIARIENNQITIKEINCKLMESKGE